MKANFSVIDGGRTTGDGGGPEGPSMEDRLEKLEQQFGKIETQLAQTAKTSDVADVKAQLTEMTSQLAHLAKATDVAEIKGRLAEMPKAVDFGRLDGRINQLPTTFQLITGLIATWTIGATMVFTLLRLFGK